MSAALQIYTPQYTDEMEEGDRQVNTRFGASSTSVVHMPREKESAQIANTIVGMGTDRVHLFFDVSISTLQEDLFLLDLIKKNYRENELPEVISWSHISRQFPGRGAKQCRERYVKTADSHETN